MDLFFSLQKEKAGVFFTIEMYTHTVQVSFFIFFFQNHGDGDDKVTQKLIEGVSEQEQEKREEEEEKKEEEKEEKEEEKEEEKKEEEEQREVVYGLCSKQHRYQRSKESLKRKRGESGEGGPAKKVQKNIVPFHSQSRGGGGGRLGVDRSAQLEDPKNKQHQQQFPLFWTLMLKKRLSGDHILEERVRRGSKIAGPVMKKRERERKKTPNIQQFE